MKINKKLTALFTVIAMIVLLIPIGVKAAAEEQFTVVYYGNGATSGTMDNQKFYISDPTQTVNTNTFSREGYEFTNWNIKADGTGTVIISNQGTIAEIINQLGVVANSQVELYAQWKENPVPTTTPAPVSSNVETKEDFWCITYLDCNGNTVGVQWIKTGGSPDKPAGYNYPDAYNISAHQDIRPISCNASDFVVPDTADRG